MSHTSKIAALRTYAELCRSRERTAREMTRRVYLAGIDSGMRRACDGYVSELAAETEMAEQAVATMMAVRRAI